MLHLGFFMTYISTLKGFVLNRKCRKFIPNSILYSLNIYFCKGPMLRRNCARVLENTLPPPWGGGERNISRCHLGGKIWKGGRGKRGKMRKNEEKWGKMRKMKKMRKIWRKRRKDRKGKQKFKGINICKWGKNKVKKGACRVNFGVSQVYRRKGKN